MTSSWYIRQLARVRDFSCLQSHSHLYVRNDSFAVSFLWVELWQITRVCGRAPMGACKVVYSSSSSSSINQSQCVAVCCSVLQFVTVCCSVLQCVAVCYSVLQSVAACCNVLQCAAVWCSVLQCLECLASGFVAPVVACNVIYTYHIFIYTFVYIHIHIPPPPPETISWIK